MNAAILLCVGGLYACADIRRSTADAAASAPSRPPTAADASDVTQTSDSAEAAKPENRGSARDDGGNREPSRPSGNDAAIGPSRTVMDAAVSSTPPVMGNGLALGQACSNAESCGSGHCVDDVCCEADDCGICGRCGTTGQCEKIVNGPDYRHCRYESAWCNEASECVLLEGDGCGGGPSVKPPCLSGICDGVCCNQTCGICERCARSGSGCEPVAYSDDRNSCAEDRTCFLPGQCATVATQQTSVDADIFVEQDDGAVEQYAQTFTLASAAKLIGLWVDGCTSVATWSLNTVDGDGLPTNSAVAEAAHVELEDPSAFTSSLTVSYDAAAGAQLAIVGTFGPEVGCNFFYGSNDPYPNGQLFYRASEDEPWSALDGQDLSFRVIAE